MDNDGNQMITSELYGGGGNVFQIRDSFGRKLLERESAEKIWNWLKKQPIRDYEIWILDASPGKLKKIVTANRFILEHEKSKP